MTGSLRQCPNHPGWTDQDTCFECDRATELGILVQSHAPTISAYPLRTELLTQAEFDQRFPRA